MVISNNQKRQYGQGLSHQCQCILGSGAKKGTLCTNYAKWEILWLAQTSMDVKISTYFLKW